MEKLNIKDIELQELNMEEELAINGGACTSRTPCKNYNDMYKNHGMGYCPYY